MSVNAITGSALVAGGGEGGGVIVVGVVPDDPPPHANSKATLVIIKVVCNFMTLILLRGTHNGMVGDVQNALDEIGFAEYVPGFRPDWAFNAAEGEAQGLLTEPRQLGMQVRWKPEM